MNFFSTLIITLFVQFSYAHQVEFGLYGQETKNIYKGQHSNLTLFYTPQSLNLRQVRIGLEYLAGQYTNTTLQAGATLAFEDFYSEFDAEFAKLYDRKPYSRYTLMNYFGWRSYEFGLGFQYGDFKPEDMRLFQATVKHYFNDTDYLIGRLYLDLSQSELKSYSLGFKKNFQSQFDLQAHLGLGKSQEDVGVIQKYTSLNVQLSYELKNKDKLSLSVTRSWGELFEDDIFGVSYLCNF
jgi:hypothetical protein